MNEEYFKTKLDEVINRLFEIKNDNTNFKTKLVNIEFQLGKYYEYLQIVRELYGVDNFLELYKYYQKKIEEVNQYFHVIYNEV